ncbi:hypothetical protein BD410DRAFT_844043 [Rickenella mellea]|uniref:Uncharacterized protein n=1 Tax=Rickenella mellea TaxID=50990 RepID=A0A4Y7PNU3_9AGAM|nr:hypothetical protein BD410DRAFT_844043 [Rickenella mellea]
MTGVALSCIEALHWTSRCPTTIAQESPFDLATNASDSSTVGQINLAHRRTTHARWIPLGYRSSPVSEIFRCTLSTVVLAEVFRVEQALTPNTGGPPTYGAIFLAAASNMQHQLRLMYDGDCSGNRELDAAFQRGPSVSELGPIPYDTNFFGRKIKQCREFRTNFAMWMVEEFHHSIGIETARPGCIVLRSLCDAVTHLPDFPESTQGHQLAIFQLLDQAYKLPDYMSSNSVHDVAIHHLKNVIVGPQSRHDIFLHREWSGRREIHQWMFTVTRVVGCEGNLFDPSSSDLQITFEDYCSVLERLACHLRGNSPADIVNHDDAHAEAINDFLRCRLRNNSLTNTTRENMGAHYADVRELNELSQCTTFTQLLWETAENFGYLSEIDDSDSTVDLETD